MNKETLKTLIVGIIATELKDEIAIDRQIDMATKISNVINGEDTPPPFIQRCDKCGCLPVILHLTDSGKLCEQCYRVGNPFFFNFEWSQK